MRIPFGPGVEYDVDVGNYGVPELERLRKEQQDRENVDTPEEMDFGNAKLRERKRQSSKPIKLHFKQNVAHPREVKSSKFK